MTEDVEVGKLRAARLAKEQAYRAIIVRRGSWHSSSKQTQNGRRRCVRPRRPGNGLALKVSAAGVSARTRAVLPSARPTRPALRCSRGRHGRGGACLPPSLLQGTPLLPPPLSLPPALLSHPPFLLSLPPAPLPLPLSPLSLPPFPLSLLPSLLSLLSSLPPLPAVLSHPLKPPPLRPWPRHRMPPRRAPLHRQLLSRRKVPLCGGCGWSCRCTRWYGRGPPEGRPRGAAAESRSRPSPGPARGIARGGQMRESRLSYSYPTSALYDSPVANSQHARAHLSPPAVRGG